MGRTNWTDDKLIFRLSNDKSDKSRWDNISVLRGRPILEENLRVINNDMTIDFEWKKDLKDCIDELTSVDNCNHYITFSGEHLLKSS